MSNTNESEDEKFAKQLQEQFNSEIEAAKNEAAVAKGALSPEEQLLADMEYARKLMEEEEKSPQTSNEKATSSTDPKEMNLMVLQKKQQEEMDILVAMKLQQE